MSSSVVPLPLSCRTRRVDHAQVQRSDVAVGAKVRWPYELFFFKQKTAYEIGLGIPAEPLFRSTSQEAVQNQNEPQLRDENAHNDKSVHGVLNPTYQAGLRRDAVQPDIEAERKKRDEIEAGKSYCSRRFGGA